MEGVVEPALAGATVLLAITTAVAYRRVGATAPVGMREIADLLALLTAVAVAATGSALYDAGWVAAATDGALNALITLFPWLLIRVVGAFEPISRRIRWSVAGATVPAVALALFAPEATDDPTTQVWMALVVAMWLGTCGLAAARFWRGGRRVSSTVGRRRSVLMAAGTGLMAMTIVAAAAEGVLGGGYPTLSVTLGLMAIVLFTTGFAPPDVLRAAWSRRDLDVLQAAEVPLLRQDEPELIAAQLLPPMARLLGASAAALRVDGELLAEYGRTDELRQLELSPDVDGITVTPVPDDCGRRHRLVAPTGAVTLTALIAPYSLLFAGAGQETFRSLMRRLDLALDRARLQQEALETTRLAAEAQRVREIEQLREDVLATISHELRTPLTMVQGGSELLRERWDSLPEAERLRLTKRVAANADELSELVQQALSLTSLRLEGIGGRSEPVRLADIAREAVREFGPGLDRRQVDVEATAPIVTVSDPDLIRQILAHLLANAEKFSDETAPIRVVVRARGGTARIAVHDEGPGLTEDELDQVFEPFYRGGHVLHRETRGLGVGLPIARHLSRALGGRIEVSSRPGEGSTFTLCLPMGDDGRPLGPPGRWGDAAGEP